MTVEAPDRQGAEIRADLVEWARQAMSPDAFPLPFNAPLSYIHRRMLITELAADEVSQAALGRKYGRTANAIRQFAFQHKDAIYQEERALHRALMDLTEGEANYRVRCLKDMLAHAQAVLHDLNDIKNELVESKRNRYWSLAELSVYDTYHENWCRYRRLELDIVIALRFESNARKRRRLEEEVCEIDDLFEPVCPRCNGPIPAEQYTKRPAA